MQHTPLSDFAARPLAQRGPWQRLTRAERVVVVAGALVAAGQVFALARLSEESVHKGERLRAGQAAAGVAQR